MLERAEIESAADVAERALFDAIIEQRIPPGAPLRLQELADGLGMSMMPVREAIRRLAALDLVDFEPRRVARVRELSLSDLEDTYFSRLHLESLAVREAAARFDERSSEEAAAALSALMRAREIGDRVAARDAHERFHFAIYEASGRGWLVRSILPGWRNSERYRAEGYRETAADRDREHAEILEALRSGDSERAVRCMREHLESSIRLSAQALASDLAHAHTAGAHTSAAP